MNKAMEVCERNELITLIKRISWHKGGDDQDWLKAYAKEIIFDRERKSALECFRSLANGVPMMPIVNKVNTQSNQTHMRKSCLFPIKIN